MYFDANIRFARIKNSSKLQIGLYMICDISVMVVDDDKGFYDVFRCKYKDCKRTKNSSIHGLCLSDRGC